ncbi:arrestin domain-containing protein 4 [Patella vulgata]|uniref:arrestin domain-containing protein 4 n=1 Tax=Patella vulgata TaxID=6465 RepID=UPI00217F6160|nr:arrestin domain-containing protein 4 [Patella vulgata]XP_050396852.1 arrestin domain-containing protein 4 [Patella vulgata]XP_050396861.1 arrestin domain-containing protein 4 [Patella vulgata]XP_050396870.1 arrestin domain-containing protein 4 [Patella vulgata]XP_050396875.1 arrestin domain-containing protein 4 [Patella vulgata]
MSAIDSINISLEHDIDEQYQYQPGEIVRGYICVMLRRPTLIRSVYLSIYGEGNVSFEDDRTGDVHQAQETYIDSSSMIVEANSGRPLSLPSGSKNFPFEYQLPENLPSSFIGKYGSVTYILKGTVQGIKSNDTGITSEPFLVLQKRPLPASIESPILLKGSKRVLKGCSLGKISVEAGADKHGGIPGEDIFIHAEVKNRSARRINLIQAAIVMNSRYHADKKTVTFSQIVNRKKDETNMGENEGRRWLHSRLTVPPYIPETRLEHCDIIEISYTFQFRVEISGGAEICLESPLLIGAHPDGLELPDKQTMNKMVNSQWTVRDKGLGLDSEQIAIDEDRDINNWHGGVIPELRSDSAISNPLFRQGSFLNNNGKYPEEMKIRKRSRQQSDRVEIMESTKL